MNYKAQCKVYFIAYKETKRSQGIRPCGQWLDQGRRVEERDHVRYQTAQQAQQRDDWRQAQRIRLTAQHKNNNTEQSRKHIGYRWAPSTLESIQ
jgi:hypothetical protein